MKTVKASTMCYDNKSKRNRDTVIYTVIHYTGNNNDTAEGNANYYKVGGAFEKGVLAGRNRKAGAHFFIDRFGNVIKMVDLNRTAWSVGGDLYNDVKTTGGGKLHGKATNANSVSIELCDIATKDVSSIQIDAIKKTIKYIRKYCKNAKTVIRHFDVTGKHCPSRMMRPGQWAQFLTSIGEESSINATKDVFQEYKVKISVDSLNIRQAPNTSSNVVGICELGDIYMIVEEDHGWGRLKGVNGWINISNKYVKKLI